MRLVDTVVNEVKIHIFPHNVVIIYFMQSNDSADLDFKEMVQPSEERERLPSRRLDLEVFDRRRKGTQVWQRKNFQSIQKRFDYSFVQRVFLQRDKTYIFK